MKEYKQVWMFALKKKRKESDMYNKSVHMN